MDKDIVIRVENLTKIYKLYDTPQDRFKEAFHPFRKKYHRDFYALNNISFEVKKGDTVGIIGKNGSGKSTLLKILTGVLTPTSGSYIVNGKVSALLELGAGFNPELTGLENVYFSCTIMGFSRKEIDDKIDRILSFADIGEFIHQPVKTYSSGMFVRLAFSVATQIDPEILIVDEALSVGDMFFQAKCMMKMKKMIEDMNTTLLFVSHDTASVKALCKRGILLDKGIINFNGESSVAIEKYFSMKIRSEQQIVKKEDNQVSNSSIQKKGLIDFFSPTPDFLKASKFQRIQNGKAEFKNVVLLDENNIELKNVSYNQKVKLRMAIDIHEDIHLLGYGYHIRDRNGIDVIYSTCSIENTDYLTDLKAGNKYIIDWDFNVKLMHGYYNIVSVISIPFDLELGKVDFCDLIPISCQFTVEPRHNGRLYGLVSWDNTVNIEKVL